MEYRSPKDLAIFDRCATSRRIPADWYDGCFALPLDGDHGPERATAGDAAAAAGDALR